MTILAVGGTGQLGRLVVSKLAQHGADIAVLTRNPGKAQVPPGVRAIEGDVPDPATMRAALRGVDTLFLVNPVIADELTRALLTLRLARDAGLKGIVYVSMVNADALVDVPHAAAKYASERMIETLDLPATILRPNYFFQNDAMIKDALLDRGVYTMPIGNVGAAMVDIRDIADVAALELLKRDHAAGRLPRDLIDISGPEVLSATSVTSIWTDALGKPISYGGDNLDVFERESRAHMPSAMALDIALMFAGWQNIGVLPMPGSIERLTAMLGRSPRTYRAFAEEMAAHWRP